MGFEEIKGQSKAIGILQTSLWTGRIAHAYMFYGPGGVGKKKAAFLFAQALNCKKTANADSCGVCASCSKIKSGNHPDIIQVLSEGNSIKITQIRGLQEKAFLKCYEGIFKVIIIDGADKLTVEAANSLLKILEEPPEQTVFILLAEELGKLPKTIISRCQLIPFLPLEAEVIQKIIEEHGQRNDFPIGLAYGSAGKALEIQKNVDIAKTLEDVVKLLEDLRKGGYKRLLFWAETLDKNKEQMEIMLEILLLYYRDRIVALLADESTLLLDTMAKKDYRIEECYAALNKINSAVQKIKSNINTRLVLDVLLLDLKNIEQNNEEKRGSPNDKSSWSQI